ncbi:hypothetical protein L1D26_01760 [Vibrio mediterranei]|nr:hypothetical protein [Vibrio mediterranei]MCG9661773.1 hypothetical protein [Vibrio mediterranei]
MVVGIVDWNYLAMNIEACWNRFLKAEQLVEQGHWPEAYHLFDEVLHHLPQHIYAALDDTSIKPCQFACMLTGLYDAAVSQSAIFNQLGKRHQAFDVLNNAHATFQFLSIEQTSLIHSVREVLDKQSHALLDKIANFCCCQRNATWMLELEHVQKAHYYFDSLKQYRDIQWASIMLN